VNTQASDEPKRRFAYEVVERLRTAGFQALWAGGCVRDLVLGQAPTDYDVATDATPEHVMRLFRRTVPVGVSFGVVRVLGPPGAGQVEVATFRSDGQYLDGRRPESVRFGRAEEDALRRDFTINGMFYDPIRDEVIDYVGGRADLERGVIRAIGDPRARFREDKLRLVRAVRFAARFGFSIEAETHAAIVALAAQVTVVAAERIAQELRRLLVDRSRRRGVELLAETRLLGEILPEVEDVRVAGDLEVWRRTLGTLAALEEEPPPSFPLALAALLQGVPIQEGPADATGLWPVGRVRGVLGRLRISNAEQERVAWLVRHQDALGRVWGSTPAARKELLAHAGSEDLIRLSRARCLAEGREPDVAEAACRYLRELPEGPLEPEPLITGADLRGLGIEPGPIYRELLDAVRREQLNGRLATREDALRWVEAHQHK
jgi:poly(A) polymerase